MKSKAFIISFIQNGIITLNTVVQASSLVEATSEIVQGTTNVIILSAVQVEDKSNTD